MLSGRRIIDSIYANQAVSRMGGTVLRSRAVGSRARYTANPGTGTGNPGAGLVDLVGKTLSAARKTRTYVQGYCRKSFVFESGAIKSTRTCARTRPT